MESVGAGPARVMRCSLIAVPCTVGLEGASNQGTVDAIYSGPKVGKPARLTFQNACHLDLGDKVDIHVVCAG